MAAPKIKKRTDSTTASRLPAQAAIPCLVLIGLILLAAFLLIFFGLKHTA